MSSEKTTRTLTISLRPVPLGVACRSTCGPFSCASLADGADGRCRWCRRLARRGAVHALALVAGLLAVLLVLAGCGHAHQLAAHRICAHAAGLPAQCYTVHGNGPWNER
jgi:hypothetical protein